MGSKILFDSCRENQQNFCATVLYNSLQEVCNENLASCSF